MVALSTLVLKHGKQFLICDDFAWKNRRFNRKRATKSTSAGTHCTEALLWATLRTLFSFCCFYLQQSMQTQHASNIHFNLEPWINIRTEFRMNLKWPENENDNLNAEKSREAQVTSLGRVCRWKVSGKAPADNPLTKRCQLFCHNSLWRFFVRGVGNDESWREPWLPQTSRLTWPPVEVLLSLCSRGGKHIFWSYILALILWALYIC